MSERVEAASTKAETQTPSPTTGPADSSSQRRGLRRLEPAVQMARLDPEQQPGFDAQALALLPTGALDLRNFGTWAQSGLNLVDQRVPFLARPLDVDGTVGPKTTQATKGFQGVAPQIVPGAVLPRTGRFDAATVWALEEATSSKNPAGRKSEPPRKAGLSTAAAEAGGSAVDGAQGRDPVDAAPVAPEMSEAAIQMGLQAAIQQVAPAGMSPSSAYAAIKAETLARFDDLSDKDTKRARDKLARDFAAELAKGRVSADQEPAWTRAGFFKAYWMLHCDQFANALMAKINGGALPSLNALRDRTNRAIDAKGGDPGATGATEVAGRDLAYRGATLTSLGARLKADNAEPGIGMHVKLRYTSDRPYDPSVVDELHHWFVYIGDGKFSDSFGAGQTGPSCDTFMVNWMNRDFAVSLARSGPLRRGPAAGRAAVGDSTIVGGPTRPSTSPSSTRRITPTSPTSMR
jgi:hypothetical protein